MWNSQPWKYSGYSEHTRNLLNRMDDAERDRQDREQYIKQCGQYIFDEKISCMLVQLKK